jgi:outer membrane PBP1 activator LpoA protein
MHDAAGPELRFYVSGPDAVATYGKAIADGAAGVIGPLQKPEVAALAAKPLPRPTLALNSPEPPIGQVNLFRLSLDPADEALASARWLVSAGHHEVSMLYVDDTWGERQRDLYSAALVAQGGRLRAAVPFTAGATDFAASLKDLFADRLALADIPPVDGAVPPSQLASPGPQALVVIANATDARQIALAVSYVGLRGLPLITTSQVWSGSPDARADVDLDNLVFCDSPWSLSRTTAAGDGGPLAAARGVAPQLDRQPPRLLALGADAYRLAAQLRLGHTVDSLPDGASGLLILDADGAFHRHGLGCARFSGGVPQPLPAVNAP